MRALETSVRYAYERNVDPDVLAAMRESHGFQWTAMTSPDFFYVVGVQCMNDDLVDEARIDLTKLRYDAMREFMPPELKALYDRLEQHLSTDIARIRWNKLQRALTYELEGYIFW